MRFETALVAVVLAFGVPGSALGQQLPAPAPAPQVKQQVPEYRINAGDELQIYVWGEERLQRTVKVLPDGTIAFPLVGQLVAQGLLPQQLEASITSKLQGQYRGQVPQVTVSVVNPSGMQFSVMGRVKAPGTFTPGRYVNVLEALSMAGGPGEFANLDNILLLRKQGGHLKAFRLHIGSFFKGGSNLDDAGALSNITNIEPGDTLIVP
jgi:polysaccharide export outer membrane protein